MGFIANLVTLLLFVTFGSQVIGVRMAMICYPLVMVALAYVVFHNVPTDFLQKTRRCMRLQLNGLVPARASY